MPYRQDTTWTFDLAAVDCPEFTIVCRDPEEMPARYQRKVARGIMLLQRADRTKRDLEPEDDWALNVVDEYMRDAIVSWNLPDPTSGKVLPLDVPDAMDPVPAYIFREIARRLGERLMAPTKSSD